MYLYVCYYCFVLPKWLTHYLYTCINNKHIVIFYLVDIAQLKPEKFQTYSTLVFFPSFCSFSPILSPSRSIAPSIYHQFNFSQAPYYVIYGFSHTIKTGKIRLFTFPTYCGSDPMYSSSTKNWFHTQPLLTRWNPAAPFLIGPTKLLACSLPVLLRPSGGEGRCKEETEPSSTRIQRNSSRQFLVSIGDLWGSGHQVEVQWWELSHTETTCEGGYGEWVRRGGCPRCGKAKNQFSWACQDPTQRFMGLITWRKENKNIVLKVWILLNPHYLHHLILHSSPRPSHSTHGHHIP